MITDCEHYMRDQEACHYTFSVEGQQYTGFSSVGSDVYFGQTKVVYYDSQNIARNTLQDFSEKSRKDRNLAYLFVLVVFVMVSFVLYSNSPNRNNSNQQTL